ncbi:MAG: adenylate kinase [Clostridia bacterium]
MNIILLGAPGAGKGSQASIISAKYNIPHISTGDILRRNIKEQTQLGKLAKSYIDAGGLVPDDVVIDIVKNRLTEADAQKGYILDGFPRTLPQAEALDRVANIDIVLNIVVPFEIIEERLTGRRVCICGATYHISTLKDNICQKCGQPLFIRDDDKIETVKARLQVYLKQTAPLIEYYEAKGLVKNILGRDTVEHTFEGVKEVLGK